MWYFLRWMVAKPGGSDWISLNIDSWFALGAPWLGAPKSLRTITSGEKVRSVIGFIEIYELI